MTPKNAARESQQVQDILASCRQALVECLADATEVSLVHMFAADTRLREYAKNALLCAHGCARTLRLLSAAQVDLQEVARELHLVGSLCASCAVETRDVASTLLTLRSWQAACETAAAVCTQASARLAKHARVVDN